MKYTLITIVLLALTSSTEGNPVAAQEKSIRKARQTSFEPLYGMSSYFGNPYLGGRLNHQGDRWNGRAHGLGDLGLNWEAGAGLGYRRNGWQWDVDGKYRSDNSWDLESSLSYDRDNFGGYLSGTVDSSGDFSVGAGLAYLFKKRSAESVNERFNVTLRADPCKFSAYDLNRDGVITKFEFQTIFGSDENTRNLFNALDMTTGDGILIRDEFEAMAERVIEECQPASE